MSKHRKTRRIYDAALQYEKIYAAWHTVKHTCKNKRGLYDFALFAHARISQILDDLKDRRYWPNKYRCFMIFEPKPRLVMSQSVRDKVINHFVAREYLLPILEPGLIDTNVATRKKKGSKYAMQTVRRYFSQMLAKRPGEKIYALKVDVSKYFYTIDHEILFQKLRQKIKDPDVLEILHRIVSETNKPYINKTVDFFNEHYGTTIPHYEQGRGLSIGAMTSQFLAIFYLNDVDHYIKEDLKCKYYLRYMDDFLLLSHDKAWLERTREEITCRLHEVNLEVNPKTAIYDCTDGGGFAFLGYRYYVDRRGVLRVVCLSGTVRRIRARLKKLFTHDFPKYLRSYESYRGYFIGDDTSRRMEDYVGPKTVIYQMQTDFSHKASTF